MQISSLQLSVIAETLASHAIDAAASIGRAGLAGIESVCAGSRRPAAELDAMMRVAQQASGDPGFGLVVATSLAQTRHGTLALLALHAPTLRDFLDDIGRYARLVQDESELSYELRGGQCVLMFAPLGTTEAGRRFRAEQIMGGLMMVLRHCGVRNADVIHTHFTHPQPAYVARCRALFGGVVRFGQPGCEIAFDASWLDARQERRDASAYALAQARAQAELADIEGRRSIGLAVTRLLERSRAPLPGMAQAAALLGMSERTLRRQLAAAGLSYAELYEARRRSEIERLLIQGDMPLKEIAEAVGYASVGSFHRAFRRHSGLTPLQWLRGRHADAAVAP